MLHSAVFSCEELKPNSWLAGEIHQAQDKFSHFSSLSFKAASFCKSDSSVNFTLSCYRETKWAQFSENHLCLPFCFTTRHIKFLEYSASFVHFSALEKLLKIRENATGRFYTEIWVCIIRPSWHFWLNYCPFWNHKQFKDILEKSSSTWGVPLVFLRAHHDHKMNGFVSQKIPFETRFRLDYDYCEIFCN